jgi:hypothetical protein
LTITQEDGPVHHASLRSRFLQQQPGDDGPQTTELAILWDQIPAETKGLEDGSDGQRAHGIDRAAHSPSDPLQILVGSVSSFFTPARLSHLATRLNTTVLRSVGASSLAVETRCQLLSTARERERRTSLGLKLLGVDGEGDEPEALREYLILHN